MEAVVASMKPFYKELKKGRTYYWCSCGRSQKQPFCDSSHVGTGFEPIKYVATGENEEVLFCGCKQTGTGPFCDGSHNNLPGSYDEDDPESPANRAIVLTEDYDGARALLDGGCYVFSPESATLETRDGIRYCPVISEAQGAVHQSQFYVETTGGKASPVMSFGDRHVILLITEGGGQVTISGRSFAIGPTDGVYVRPGEAFQVTPTDGAPLKLLASACPAAAEIGWLDAMPDNFDARQPERVVKVDPDKRTAMATRFFQMLVDKTIGSDVVTQFIGHIPLSKAEPHRHLYEEALIILSGHGVMWTDTRKAKVRAGDVIFLPRKVRHSLQSSAPEGMDLVGVIFPGDNPSINY